MIDITAACALQENALALLAMNNMSRAVHDAAAAFLQALIASTNCSLVLASHPEHATSAWGAGQAAAARALAAPLQGSEPEGAGKPCCGAFEGAGEGAGRVAAAAAAAAADPAPDMSAASANAAASTDPTCPLSYPRLPPPAAGAGAWTPLVPEQEVALIDVTAAVQLVALQVSVSAGSSWLCVARSGKGGQGLGSVHCAVWAGHSPCSELDLQATPALTLSPCVLIPSPLDPYTGCSALCWTCCATQTGICRCKPLCQGAAASPADPQPPACLPSPCHPFLLFADHAPPPHQVMDLLRDPERHWQLLPLVEELLPLLAAPLSHLSAPSSSPGSEAPGGVATGGDSGAAPRDAVEHYRAQWAGMLAALSRAAASVQAVATAERAAGARGAAWGALSAGGDGGHQEGSGGSGWGRPLVWDWSTVAIVQLTLR